MSININSNFLLNTQLPLDARTVVLDATARDAIITIQRYEGLSVYLTSTSETFQLQGGITNGDWVEITGGGVVTDANNGLSLSGTIAQLGGTLIQNTTINRNTAFLDIIGQGGVNSLALSDSSAQLGFNTGIDFGLQELSATGANFNINGVPVYNLFPGQMDFFDASGNALASISDTNDALDLYSPSQPAVPIFTVSQTGDTQINNIANNSFLSFNPSGTYDSDIIAGQRSVDDFMGVRLVNSDPGDQAYVQYKGGVDLGSFNLVMGSSNSVDLPLVTMLRNATGSAGGLLLTSQSGFIAFGKGTDGFGTDEYARFINSNGFLGLGTLTPGNRLDIANNGSLATGFTGLRVGVTSATTVVGAATKVLAVNASGDVGLYSISGAAGGTVTSVALALPSIFTISGSPVTTTGTLTGTFNTQTANLVFAGPASGSAATPTFRALVTADLPSSAVTGSGSSGQVSFWTGTNTQSGDNGLFWDNTKKFLGLGTNAPASLFHLSGSISAAAWGTNGIGIRQDAATYTDTSSSGAVSGVTSTHALGIPTWVASSATTFANSATLYIGGQPTASTNVTITNPYSVYVLTGNVFLGGRVIGTGFGTSTSLTNGNFAVAGNTNGTGTTNTSATQFQFGGSTTVMYRTLLYGSNSTSLASTNNYGAFIVGTAPITTFTSGIHALLANTVFNPIGTITVAGTASVTNTATVYINGANGGTVTGINYGLWATGNTRFDLGSDATGDIFYRASTGVLTRLAIGTSTQVLHGGTVPSYSAVSLTADVSGTLPIANGGTGATTLIGAGITNVVTTVQLTAQTANIGSTNFTGTSTAGLYRVSYSLEDTTADLTAGAVTVTIAYTSAAGATTVVSAAQLLTGTGVTQGTVYVQLSSGSISYSTSHTGIFGTAAYALYMTVERVL